MIDDGMLLVQSGRGTLQFPLDQVDRILALPTQPDPNPNAVPVIVHTGASSNNAVANAEELLLRAALLEGLEPDFVRSVAMIESGLHQEVLSPKGAVGLMQLMPFIAGQLGVNANLAEQNAIGGATFLRQLLIRYKGDSVLALAAYNAGPGAVDKYKGVPPYLETRRYVVKVLREYTRQRLQADKALQAAAKADKQTDSNTASNESLRAQRTSATAPVAILQ